MTIGDQIGLLVPRAPYSLVPWSDVPSNENRQSGVLSYKGIAFPYSNGEYTQTFCWISSVERPYNKGNKLDREIGLGGLNSTRAKTFEGQLRPLLLPCCLRHLRFALATAL